MRLSVDILATPVTSLANVTDIWFGLMPPLMFIATAGLVIAEYNFGYSPG